MEVLELVKVPNHALWSVCPQSFATLPTSVGKSKNQKVLILYKES
jgi:hypothetical protein